ncbi:MAG: 4-hydroxy-tetrahydrodipicolinate synthase [Caedimonas sp.]|nr:4-hydroxy-tetrahydrodipicolinate synthase [Caedimonas sp.]
MFKGSLVALITPYKNNFIDERALEKLVEWHIAEGTHGIVACGSTGEGALLTREEQRRILEICANTAARRIPVIANVSAVRLEDALSLAHQAQNTEGIQGLMLTPPPYIKPTQEAIYQFIKTVHDETELPIIMYNNPGRCGVDMSRETIVHLAKLPRIAGLKDSSGDVRRVPEQAALVPSSFVQLCGEDELNVPFMAQGGHGWISVTANAAPRLCVQIYESWRQGDLRTFARLRDFLDPLHKAIVSETNPAPIKYAVARQGFCSDEVRCPLVKATVVARKAVDQALQHAGIIAVSQKDRHG